MSYYTDPWLTVHLGDCRAVMAEMEPESVHCVVTSPPYWGLRDYGTPGQLGLEPTPEAYVEAMVAVFREVRRVLRSDGTVWLNLGDSYSGGGGYAPDAPSNQKRTAGDDAAWGALHRSSVGARSAKKGTGVVAGLKPKDLVGIPWRVAFALQADGWYLRSDIIWAKPNPMPESTRDRPTKSHEYIFLLSKSPRYYYDAAAIREPMKEVSLKRLSQPNVLLQPGGPKDPKTGNRSHKKAINNQAERLIAHEKWKTRFEGWDEYDKSLGRNARSVWTVATQPYPGAHFATFPPKLIEPCIKAGCPEGGFVLDPFAGSGTTAMVANRLSRRAVLIDLNADYLGQVMDRNRALPLGLETA